jgi:hypothetical protein
MANVAALSGLTGAWRRVFRGAGSRDGLRTTATMPAKSVLTSFSHLKPTGASTKLSFVARKKSVPSRLPWLAGPGQVSVVDEKNICRGLGFNPAWRRLTSFVSPANKDGHKLGRVDTTACRSLWKSATTASAFSPACGEGGRFFVWRRAFFDNFPTHKGRSRP